MKKNFIIYFSIVCAFIFSIATIHKAQAQLTVTQGASLGMTPLQLVQQVLVGNGVTVSNATFNGSAANITSNMIGSYNAAGTAATQLGFTGGVIIASGNTADAIGPNSSGGAGTSMGTGSDPDLQLLIPSYTVYDKAVLEFDFIPISDTVKFRYVFGSEEFDEFCYSSYNDVFGFFISGPGITGPFSNNAKNIALMPNNPSNYVTIDNVCSAGSTYSWLNNGGLYYQYDRLTKVYTAWSIVQSCQQYHIKLAVGDAGDEILDSGVFLEANSFTSPGLDVTAISSTGDSAMAEGCGAATYYFSRSGVIYDTLTICFQIGGTAVNGVDYTDITGNPIDSCVTFYPGQDTVILQINPEWDGVTEPTETITLTVTQLISCDTIPISASIYILNVDSLEVAITNDSAICKGYPLTLTVSPINGIAPYTYNWNNGAWSDSSYIVSPPLVTGVHNYTVEVTDSCGNYASEEVIVTVNPIPTSSFTLSDLICNIQDAQITYTGDAPSNATYLWDFDGGTVLSGTGQGPYMINWQQPGMPGVSLTVTSLSCTGSTTVDSIEIVICPLIIPNVFTPNGDDKNQYFFITNLEYYPNSKLTIFNRWGNNMYESSNYQNNWDGEGHPDGTYFYILTLLDGSSYHGIVTILY